MSARLRPKVYLAGPGVFRPNAAAHGARLKRECANYGLEGLWPLDNEPELAGAGSPLGRAAAIFAGNVHLIRLAAAVVADISPFRGPHMDPGTAFEIGVAHAVGMPVFAYTSAWRPEAAAVPLIGRVWCEQKDGVWRDALGNQVEDFGLAENLMVACAVQLVAASATFAIEACARHLAAQTLREAS